MKNRLAKVAILFVLATLAAFGLAFLGQRHDRLRDNATRLITLRGIIGEDGYTTAPYFRWINDQTLLLFRFSHRNEPLILVRYDRTTRKQTETPVPVVTRRWARDTSQNLSVSPDQTRLLVPIVDERDSVRRMGIYPRPPVKYMPLILPLASGAKPIVLPEIEGNIQWTPDGELASIAHVSVGRSTFRSRLPSRFADDYEILLHSIKKEQETRHEPLPALNQPWSRFGAESQMQIVAVTKTKILIKQDVPRGISFSTGTVPLMFSTPRGSSPAIPVMPVIPGTTTPPEMVAASRDGTHLLWREDARARHAARPATTSWQETLRNAMQDWLYRLIHSDAVTVTPFALWETDGEGHGLHLVAEYAEDVDTRETRATLFQYLPGGEEFSFRQDGAIWTRRAR